MLYRSEKLARQLHGQLSSASSRGAGASFTVAFPGLDASH